MIKYLLFILFTVCLLQSCEKSNSINDYTSSADCANVPVQNTYNGSVKSILNASCAYAGCHDTNTAKENIILDTYTSAKKVFASGEGLCTVYHDCTPMPEGAAKLSTEKLNILACWVKNGTPE